MNSDIIGTTSLPHHALLIAQLNINAGGLGILDPRSVAIPDFMLSFTSPRRHATNCIYLNKHLRTVPIHSTISNLFSLSTIQDSLILQRYHHLLPQIAEIACPPTTPCMDLAHYFPTTLSPHSACGCLKKHCTHTVKSELYHCMFEHESVDFHLLPGIFSTQTSYPIIRMSRSAIKHHLSPLNLLICIRLKLRLPIYPPNTRFTCRHHNTMCLATTPSAAAVTKVI